MVGYTGYVSINLSDFEECEAEPESLAAIKTVKGISDVVVSGKPVFFTLDVSLPQSYLGSLNGSSSIGDETVMYYNVVGKPGMHVGISMNDHAFYFTES